MSECPKSPSGKHLWNTKGKCAWCGKRRLPAPAVECSKSPTGKHEYKHFRCIWCGLWTPGTLKARYKLSMLMREQLGVRGVVTVEKDAKTFVVPLAVARAFNMKIVKKIPEEEIEESLSSAYQDCT